MPSTIQLCNDQYPLSYTRYCELPKGHTGPHKALDVLWDNEEDNSPIIEKQLFEACPTCGENLWIHYKEHIILSFRCHNCEFLCYGLDPVKGAERAWVKSCGCPSTQ